jgi:hypothetical protein
MDTGRLEHPHSSPTYRRQPRVGNPMLFRRLHAFDGGICSMPPAEAAGIEQKRKINT